MSILGNKGREISFDASDMIKEVKKDINDGLTIVVGYYDWVEGIKIYKDYDGFMPGIDNFDDQEFINVAKEFDGKDKLNIKTFLDYLIKENEIV